MTNFHALFDTGLISIYLDSHGFAEAGSAKSRG
jgi:hypothetical protein